MGVFLNHVEIFNKIHITLFGERELAFLDMQCGIGEYPQISTKSEVLLVVGQELQMVALVTVHIHRINDIIAVESHGILAYRTGKRILQESDLVVIQVNICKHILEQRVQDVARFKQVVDTRRVLPHDDALLAFRVFAVEVLGHRLIHRERQYQFVVVRAHLNLVDEPFLFLEFLGLQVGGIDVVECKGDFLIFIVLIIIMVGQIGAFLGLHNTFHQFNRRIVLAAVFLLFGLDGHPLQALGVFLEGDTQFRRSVWPYQYTQGLVAHCTEREIGPIVTLDGEPAIDVSSHRLIDFLILHGGERDAVACSLINTDNCLRTLTTCGCS